MTATRRRPAEQECEEDTRDTVIAGGNAAVLVPWHDNDDNDDDKDIRREGRSRHVGPTTGDYGGGSSLVVWVFVCQALY